MSLRRRFLISFVFSLGRLPLRVRRFLAWLVGSVLGSIPIRDQKIARLQIKTFLEPRGIKASVRKVYESFCLTFLEALNMAPLLKNDTTLIRFDQWAEVRSLQAEGKGAIYLSGHTGNWELLAAYLIKNGLNFYPLGRRARHPVTNEILEGVRERHNVHTLWRQDNAGVKEIVRVLRGGGGIAALLDQDTEVSSGFAPFFGSQAKTPVALISLAQKLGCRICVLLLVRETKSTYRVFYTPLDESKEVTAILADYNQALEDVVRKYPEQWPWFHKRWRSRPDGRKFSSKEYIRCLRTDPRSFFRSEA